MTDLNDELVTADRELTRRVQDAVQSGHFGASLRSAAGVLGIQIKWYEADVLAEALSHHYEHTVTVYRVVHEHISVEEYRRIAAPDLLRELLETAHKAGQALIEEPVETIHSVREYNLTELPTSPPLDAEQIAEITDHGRHFIVVLTGRCRTLAKPRPAATITPRGTHAH